MVHCQDLLRSASKFLTCFKPLQSGAMVHWGASIHREKGNAIRFKPLQSGAMVH